MDSGAALLGDGKDWRLSACVPSKPLGLTTATVAPPKQRHRCRHHSYRKSKSELVGRPCHSKQEQRTGPNNAHSSAQQRSFLVYVHEPCRLRADISRPPGLLLFLHRAYAALFCGSRPVLADAAKLSLASAPRCRERLVIGKCLSGLCDFDSFRHSRKQGPGCSTCLEQRVSPPCPPDGEPRLPQERWVWRRD